MSARSDFGCDLIEMKLHGLAPSVSYVVPRSEDII